MCPVFNNAQSNIESLIMKTLNEALHASKQSLPTSEWMTLAEGAKYASVSNNTFMKFRVMGLKVSHVEGIKRVSRKEIDKFLDNNSF